MQKAFAFLTLVVSLCSACTYQHTRDKTGEFMRTAGLASDYQVRRSSGWILHGSTRVCLLTAEPDANTGVDLQLNQQLSRALARELSQAFEMVEVRVAQSDTAEISVAKELLTGTMAEWQEGTTAKGPAMWPCEVTVTVRVEPASATEPSQVSDGEILALIDLRDVASGRLLDHTAVTGKAGLLPLFQEMPQQLVEGAMRAYVSSISSKA